MSLIKHTTWLLLSLSLTASMAFAQDAPPQQEQPPQSQSQPGDQAQAEPKPAAAKPFQLGVEQKDYVAPPPPPAPVPAYGAPQMVPGTPTYAPPPPPPRPPLQAGVQQTQIGVLPPQFLGRWQVQGSRSQVEALPQFQAGMDGIFAINTQNIWNIQGNPQKGYMLNTDQGVSTPLLVQTTGDTAILKYQHPIRNTVAQEALVMQLLPGGAMFNGLERISIVKQGEGVRAKVQYNLVGHRQ